MDGQPTRYWGKFEPDPPRWHPLEHHCADVAACLEALLSLDVMRRRLARTGGLSDLDRPLLNRLAFLGALHDMGKFNLGFQDQLFEGRPRAGHVRPAFFLFKERSLQEKAIEAINFGSIASWTGSEDAALGLILASISHHGRPVGDGDGVDPRVWKADGQRDPLGALKAFVREVRGWFGSPLHGADGGGRIPTNPEFQHAFAGFVMLADWLASDPRLFPYSSSLDEPRFLRAREMVKTALLNLCIDTSRTRVSTPVLPGFRDTFGYGPRPLQEEVETVQVPEGGSVTILEAETGSGKTEAAFRHFLRLFHSGLVDGMYFALPTRSAATQIHGRIRQAAGRAFGSEAPPVVLAVPGYIRVDDTDADRLAPFRYLWPDEDRMRYRGWAAEHPKRYLAGTLVVGTIDQVLLSALQVSHAHMRASALLRHLLVVDEVHSSDVYMTTLLEAVLKTHLGAGGHALLMSATLGSAARTTFLVRRRHEDPPPAAAASLPYPAISVGDGGGRFETIPLPSQGRQKEVRCDLLGWSGDTPRIAAAALERAREGGAVLILRNRVQDAIETQMALESLGPEARLLFSCHGVVSLHHGRFAVEDRKCLDRALEERFRAGEGDRAGIIVSTQTVEQSLDIDFDLIFTDLCPMDVLLQRVGRLHRHERQRPRGFGVARVIVMTPPERDLAGCIDGKGPAKGKARGPGGLGTVYEDLRVIEATWRLLEKESVLSIPSMNRWLVEESTHPEKLEAIVCELGGPWREHANKIAGIRVADMGAARLNTVRRDQTFNSTGVLFGGVDENVRTRLGEDDRLAKFSSTFPSPFGNSVGFLTVPGWMARDAGGEEEALVLSSDAGATVFCLGGVHFRYDRFGLRRDDVQPLD
jgi:CRISPR-associated endonuclease/helicase Cas3